jgi:hypothetical protein
METTEKNQIIEKFLTLFNESGLKKKDAAKRLGFDPAVMSYLQNEKFRKRIYPKAFVLIKDFLDSGKKLSEYQVKKDPAEVNKRWVKPDIPTEQEIKKKISDYQAGISPAAAAENKPEKKPEKSPNAANNQFTHERLAEGLIKEMEGAGMSNIEASRQLGVTPESLALVRNERYRKNCHESVWAAIKKFL